MIPRLRSLQSCLAEMQRVTQQNAGDGAGDICACAFPCKLPSQPDLHLRQAWDLETYKCVGTLLTAGKPVSRLELAAGRLYAAAGRHVLVWALPCCAPLASVEVSKECGAICSLAVGPRVRGIDPGVSMRSEVTFTHQRALRHILPLAVGPQMRLLSCWPPAGAVNTPQVQTPLHAEASGPCNWFWTLA